MKLKEKVIREARLKKEFSQEHLADLLNVSQSKYSRLEKGDITFTIDELSKLIDVLELNPLEVLDFTEKQQVFINSSYSGNVKTKINVITLEAIREMIREELTKKINF